MKNTYLWLAQLVAGILVAVTLSIHMVWMHLDTILGALGIDIKEPTSWTSMLARSREIIWATLYIALLTFGLYHALYGLRNVIFELAKSPIARRVVTWTILTLGILALAWGTYVPIVLLRS
jgi:succinate dehydrogenase hydrophobic anchor subunit